MGVRWPNEKDESISKGGSIDGMARGLVFGLNEGSAIGRIMLPPLPLR